MSSRRRTYSSLEGWLMSGEVIFNGDLSPYCTTSTPSVNVQYDLSPILPMNSKFITDDYYLIFRVESSYYISGDQSMDTANSIIEAYGSSLLATKNNGGYSYNSYNYEVNVSGKSTGLTSSYSGFLSTDKSSNKLFLNISCANFGSIPHPKMLILAIPRTDI